MKKSFILHKDALVVLDEMSDEQAGKLFKAIKAVQCGEEIELDLLTRVAITPFKAQFDRDAEKYEEFIEKQRNKGKRSAEARANRSQPRLTAVDHSQPEPTYNDSDSVSDSVSVSKKEYIPSDDGKKFADWFNEKMRPDSIKPAAKKELLDWAKVYDDLITKDKKTKKEITDATIFGRTDDFWKDNFRSPRKLRKKDSDGAMYVDIFLERIKSKEAAQIKQEQPKKFIDPQRGYDTSKPGPGKEYNPVTGQFYYRPDWTGPRV